MSQIATTASIRKRIPVSGPWITDKEVAYVAEAAQHAWYEGAGSYCRRFEAAFAERLGMRHAVALPSCTSGIHLALRALGIGPGDEVIVPDLTWIATVAPVVYVGATPVFADVDPHTWCITPRSMAAVIGPRTRAVIPVDLYGGMPDYVGIGHLAAKHDLAVIEDAAEAIGSSFRGRPAGAWGDAGVFSFHGSKTITTGEGGMLVTDRDDVFDRVQRLRDHGRQPGDKAFFNTEVGFKYKMSDLQAAFGLAQIERASEILAAKRAVFEAYAERLARDVTLNVEPAGTVNSYWMVTAVLDPQWGVSKQALIAAMSDAGVETRPLFHPLSSLPALFDRPEAQQARARNHIAQRMSPLGINLPSGPTLTLEEIERVCDTFRTCLADLRGSAAAPADDEVSEVEGDLQLRNHGVQPAAGSLGVG